MKKTIVKCPKCGSTNTREYTIGVGINITNENLSGTHMFDDKFYHAMQKEFGDNVDTEDYYCAENICDDCNCHFATKNLVDVKVTKTIVFKEYSK